MNNHVGIRDFDAESLFDSTVQLIDDQSCQYLSLSLSIGTSKSGLSKAAVRLDTLQVIEIPYVEFWEIFGVSM